MGVIPYPIFISKRGVIISPILVSINRRGDKSISRV